MGYQVPHELMRYWSEVLDHHHQQAFEEKEVNDSSLFAYE